jgi:hypothetical protein
MRRSSVEPPPGHRHRPDACVESVAAHGLVDLYTPHVTLPRTPEVEDALARACDAVRLPLHYRDCVRPLLGVGPERWPRCCGGGCEPCAEMLIEVARRVHAILAIEVT